MENSNVIDFDEIQKKIYEKLIPSGWNVKLRTFLLSEDFSRILQVLYKESEADKKFTPVLKQIFTGFQDCPYKDLKVIILGQSPYSTAEVANGTAFSCVNKGYLQPSLKYILQEVHETVYKNREYDHNPDLKRWSEQGILLLNCSLTVQIGKPDTHFDLWAPFIKFLFDMLRSYNNGLIYCFMGKVAERYADLVPDHSYRFVTSHPASAAYRELLKWDSKDFFNKCNELLIKNNGTKIIW